MRRWFVPALIVVAAACVPIAYYSVFSRPPAPYDDEGFFLVAIKLVAGGQRLYDDVVASGYGPFYYLIYVPLAHLLGGIDHDKGRFIVLALWLAGGGMCAWATHRLTRSVVLSVVAFALCFRITSVFTAEPMNPAPLLNLLLLGLLVVAARRVPSKRQLAALGALVALAALVKINIGAYAGLALAFAVVACARDVPRWLVAAVGGLVFACVPIVLMAPDWAHTRGYIFVVVVCGVAALATLLATARPALLDLRVAWRPVLAGLVGTAVAVLLLAMIVLGSTPSGLWTGIVGKVAGQRELFHSFDPVRLRPTLLVLLLVPFALRSTRAHPAWAVLRIGAGVAVALAVLLGATFERHAFATVEWTLPFVWLALLPPAGEELGFGRIFAVALALTESLYAYPVAGSQEAFAGVQLIPVAMICVADGARALVPTFAGRRALALGLAALALLGVVWGSAGAALARISDRYHHDSSLPLAGSSHMRVDADDLDRFTWVQQHLQPCSTFIPLLGMNSFYLWANKQPPGFMQQVWPRTLDQAHQRDVLRKVQRDPDVCLLINFGLLKFWSNNRPLPPSPLLTFTRQAFRLWTVDGYGDEIWVRNDRPASS